MKKLEFALAALLFATPTFAEPAPETKEVSPATNSVVTLCRTGYYNRESVQCQTREFLERRGTDLVYLVRRDGGEPAELVVTKDLSTKVRPFPPAMYAPHSYFLQFPLHVGKSWQGTFVQTSGNQTHQRTRTAKVTGYEDVVLKAGTFKAYKIEAYNQLSTAMRPAVEIYFYCPELGVICSYESREFDIREEVVAISRREVSVGVDATR